MPKLAAVRYRLFDGEEPAIEAARNTETHDFGGELVLEFKGGMSSFISWVSEPVQYAIGVKDESHFVPDASLTEFDVSDAGMWAALVGNEVSLMYIGPHNQVLRISSEDDHVLVCSHERGGWWADELTICKQMPAPYEPLHQ